MRVIVGRQGSGWFERKIVSQVSALLYERKVRIIRMICCGCDLKDYKLFSVVDVPDEDLTYLGIFGMWICLPRSWEDVKQVFSNQ